ncbi:MAG: DUF3326 domain-containing protein [Roseofilum sp. SBFL]|uniref:DUF3326 domain-containing protein n=1 Tax=unclassified Roseofilum TaxID=2620099 RepID=UPI001B2A2263|nr:MULTISPECIES: DUF3326 domain-containing protein [unclassified Roseofilum]MBP0037105.1 DUF3326 domain-containing protein [Roseofilum sp. SID1]MBP0043519.1 DUF3326 domain-containing protein [Roseofilum sp. SBFL]
MNHRPYTVVLIIPTGIGAAIGGYAGDALPVAKAIASISDRLISHPNVLNGASLYWNIPNGLYVEGYALDRFAAQDWGLRPVNSNRIGLLLDRAIEPELRTRHLQVADAARATLGLNITGYIITDRPLEVQLTQGESQASWGTLGNPDSLLRAAEKLKEEQGAEAIAAVARFPDDTDSEALQNYRQGQGIDPIAGVEAIISHLVVRTLGIPCAHSPALQPLPLNPQISPRSAAEELGYTFLPCVLVGLSRAPQLLTPLTPYHPQPTDIWGDRVDAVVVPATACGGSAILKLSQTSTCIIAVSENTTEMRSPPELLKIPVVRVNSYLEALGVLVAHRSGVSLESLGQNLLPL